jgi:hypothetical protein
MHPDRLGDGFETLLERLGVGALVDDFAHAGFRALDDLDRLTVKDLSRIGACGAAAASAPLHDASARLRHCLSKKAGRALTPDAPGPGLTCGGVIDTQMRCCALAHFCLMMLCVWCPVAVD